MNKLKFYLAGVFCLILASCFFFINQSHAAATISGQIIRNDGSPVYMTQVKTYVNDTHIDDNTDVNGNYTLNLTGTISAGVYDVIINIPQTIGIYGDLNYRVEYYYPQTTSVSVTDGANITNVNFTVTMHGLISGQITDSSGNPVFQAYFYLWNKNDSTSNGYDYTSENGSYYTTPMRGMDYTYGINVEGYYQAYIIAPGFLPVNIDNLRIIDDQALTQNITMIRKSYVSGTVKDKKGTPLSNIVIKAYKFSQNSAFTTALTNANGNYQIEIGNAGSNWSFGDFSAIGQYVLKIGEDSNSNYGYKSRKISITKDETSLTNINFSLSAKNKFLSGRILSKKKKALDGAKLSLSLIKNPLLTITAYSDSLGNYQISNLKKGVYRLTISKDGYANKEITKLKIKGNKHKNFKLAPAGIISGFVYDEFVKKPIAGITVRLINSDLTAITNSFGYYKINYVPIGKRKVFVKEIAYAEQFYSKTGNLSKAKKITVKKGQETKNTNFYLTPYSRIYK